MYVSQKNKFIAKLTCRFFSLNFFYKKKTRLTPRVHDKHGFEAALEKLYESGTSSRTKNKMLCQPMYAGISLSVVFEGDEKNSE